MKRLILFAGLLILLILCLSFRLISQPSDFGDAPDPPYPTKLINNGPNHWFLPGFFLGSFWDPEPDGMAGMLSFGDDLNNITDDEDGIRFLSFLLPGQNSTVEVVASAPGLLNAWIDWQANLQWTDPGDHIFQDKFLNPGKNILSILVPANITPGMITFARFRFSSMAGLSFTGMATDGEVEDYNILLGPPASQEIFLDQDPSFSFTQNEVSLVRISGTSSNYNGWLVAAYNDSPFIGGPGMGISLSSDNGASWTAIQLPLPVSLISGIPMAESFDPAIAFNDSGNLFAVNISTDGNWMTWPYSPSNGLYLYKSTDGGMTWPTYKTIDIRPAATTIDSNFRLNDRCQIRIDNYPSSPYHNNIYITSIQDRGNDPSKLFSDIYFTRSTDGGSTFVMTTVNSWNHNMGNMPVCDIASDGTIYLVWIDYNVRTGGLGKFYLDKSTDGGVTWGTDNYFLTVNLPHIYLNYGYSARAKGAAVLRVNPVNSQELFLVYAADADTTAPDESDIWFISSPDAGTTWTTPVRVNDDTAPADTSDQVMPWMVLQNNGTIHIAWYDRRNDPMDLIWDVYYTNSNDGGQTFDVNHKINRVSFPTPQAYLYGSWDYWMGEYLGLALGSNTVYIAYASAVQDPFGDVLFGSYNFSTSGNEELFNNGSDQPGCSLYPNPSGREINVVVTSEKKLKTIHIELYSVYGKNIFQADINDQKIFSLQVSDLASGVYWLKITTGQMTWIKRFIKVD